MMLLAVIINPRKTQEHIEHCNLAWILFIKRITVTFVVADGPLTVININN